MAVLLETSKGDIVVDLLCEDAPVASKNFLKLCKMKYYNNCLFHNVQKDFLVQTGDPTGTGRGGSSLNGVLYGEQARYFEDEIKASVKHAKRGTVAMANAGKNMNASQFYITANDGLDSLDGKHTIFGEVSEGLDAVMRINEAYCDDSGKPWQNIRIRHTIILDDPFEDPPNLDEHVPEESPVLVRGEEEERLEDDWQPVEDARAPEEIEKSVRKTEAQGRAVVLEMIGDLPDAEAKPEENLIFVCKLNPVTSEEDLEIIFSRFGKVTTCDVIKDWKTGESLCYAFIGFATNEQAEKAYLKMDNVLIDDRRIHVDFYQSMYHQWRMYKRTGKPPPGLGPGGSSEKGLPQGKRQGGGGEHSHARTRPGYSGGEGDHRNNNNSPFIPRQASSSRREDRKDDDRAGRGGGGGGGDSHHRRERERRRDRSDRSRSRSPRAHESRDRHHHHHRRRRGDKNDRRDRHSHERRRRHHSRTSDKDRTHGDN
jgi:peptidyl-prolyl cis-trans isomerase-like 4